ncbi:VOC family protein [Chitinophagaceae bacterium MMS25-I14]
METPNIPETHQAIMPYLIIPDAAGFSNFVQQVFGATETTRHMRDETIIMHAEVMIEGSIIMFADSTDQFPPQPAGMFIYVADADITYRKALLAGATSVMEPANQEYGRSCGIKDAHGNTWWITSI